MKTSKEKTKIVNTIDILYERVKQNKMKLKYFTISLSY